MRSYDTVSPIVLQGKLQPTRQQVLQCRKDADSSFCAFASNGIFSNNIPQLPDKLVFDEPVPVILKCKNVEPHTDEWGDLLSSQFSLFWLLAIKDKCWFGISGHKAIPMRSGDFVLFDDSKEHYLMSSYQWVGAVWKLKVLT